MNRRNFIKSVLGVVAMASTAGIAATKPSTNGVGKLTRQEELYIRKLIQEAHPNQLIAYCNVITPDTTTYKIDENGFYMSRLRYDTAGDVVIVADQMRTFSGDIPPWLQAKIEATLKS